MPRYKRTFEEAALETPLEDEVPAENLETLSKLRNMWEFASFMQYIFLFGHVVKIDDDFDIEDLEAECLKPTPSERLAAIGLSLLKYVSSHRGLTPEIFDEYTRRQYTAKAPNRNPFGEEEEPAKFNEFDIFTKIRVLHQLSTWTLGNTERIRGMMPQDEDHLNWRMEPLGWDKDDCAYFVLDDNRLYRRSDEPPPPPTPKVKAKPKNKSAKKNKPKGTRASKRRKIEDTSDEEPTELDVEAGAEEDTTMMTNGDHDVPEEEPGFGFTSKTWECVAITLEQYQEFLAGIFRTRDPNEKLLRKRIEEDVLPIIEKRAESLRQKQLKKMRELENLQKLATAKRSGRLADKAEKEEQERKEREIEEKKQADLKMAHEEQERQRRIEEGHESRRLTREQRVKEREVKRILHEEELAKIEEQANRDSSQDPASDAAADGSKRMSERQLKTQKEKHKKELEKMAEEEDSWVFDCAICGVHGENMDDGTHSIACERCNVWQHSECHGFSPKQAESSGFHFVCSTCKRKEEDAKKPKIPPLKLGKKASASPEAQKSSSRPGTANGQKASPLPYHITAQLDNNVPRQPMPRPGPFAPFPNGPNLSPYSQQYSPQGHRYPPVGNFAPSPQPHQAWHGGSPHPPSGYASSPPPPMANGYGSPHQQQHQYMHQNAVASSGGHPGYQGHPPPQQYGYPPATGMYPAQHSPPPPQHQHYYPPQPNYNYGYNQSPPPRHPHQQGPPQHPHQQVNHMNGSHSPVKNGQQMPSQSSQLPPQPQHSYSQAPSTHQPQGIIRSPHTNFPPPVNMHPQQGAQSPVKSSPSAPPRNQQLPQPSHQPQQTPYQLGPATTTYQTPQQAHPSPAGANANAVAADGMSGPWPESSKAIPQKHDQSPAPPASSHTVGETQILPPAAPLVPSPKATVEGPESVPVKKMPEVNGAPLPEQPQGVVNGQHGQPVQDQKPVEQTTVSVQAQH